MVKYKQNPIVSTLTKKSRRKRAIKHDIVIENWHLECHEEGSRLWKLTMALAEENAFNDLDVIAYNSCDGHMLCQDIGD